MPDDGDMLVSGTREAMSACGTLSFRFCYKNTAQDISGSRRTDSLFLLNKDVTSAFLLQAS